MLDVVVCLTSNAIKKKICWIGIKEGGDAAGEQMLDDEEHEADGKQRKEEWEGLMKEEEEEIVSTVG